MAITAERDLRLGLTVYVARCDDCGAILAAEMYQPPLERRLHMRRPGWRAGLPLFCRDMHACSERTWQRYGRYMQSMIDRIEQRQATRR